jgi:hypothetical protein
MMDSKCIDGSLFNEFDVLLVIIGFLIPALENVEGIGEMHPYVADAEGNVDEETIVPEATLCYEEEDP